MSSSLVGILTECGRVSNANVGNVGEYCVIYRCVKHACSNWADGDERVLANTIFHCLPPPSVMLNNVSNTCSIDTFRYGQCGRGPRNDNRISPDSQSQENDDYNSYSEHVVPEPPLDW